jgi:uncharacterized protein (TIGR02145 family)
MKTSIATYPILWILALAIALTGCAKEKEKDLPVITYGRVTDHEGNTYKTIQVGTQWWMAQNLIATTFADGTPIRNVSLSDSNAFWSTTTEPCYTAINSGAQGLLYNGHVIRSEKAIAPAGWHIATDADWRKLEATIGMTSAEALQTGWRGDGLAPAITSMYSVGWPSGILLFGTNATGFNARPTGCRIADGRTNIFSNTAFWWTSTQESGKNYYRYIDADAQGIFRQLENIQYGMSIRCVKD